MAGVLTSVRDDKDKAAVYLAECRRMGITVLPPDVNESVRNFAPVGTDIRFGLGGIRNVGVNVVDAIVAARREKGDFSDFSDFLRKVDAVVCNKKVIESLIKAGASWGRCCVVAAEKCRRPTTFNEGAGCIFRSKAWLAPGAPGSANCRGAHAEADRCR